MVATKAQFRRVPAPVPGERGSDGSEGKEGDRGLPGLEGRDGKDGRDGKNGRNGFNGKDGDTGARGSDGNDGATGPKGDIGKTGLQGNEGRQGARGEKGDTGDRGPVPDHQISKKDGTIRFLREDGTWGAWLKLETKVIDRTVTVQESGGRGGQVLEALKDLERLKYNIQPVKTVTEDYSAEGMDFSIVIDASSEAVTVTLPATPTKGKVYNVACLNSDNAAQIDFNGKLFYDSSDNETLFKGENLKLQYTGVVWVGG